MSAPLIEVNTWGASLRSFAPSASLSFSLVYDQAAITGPASPLCQFLMRRHIILGHGHEIRFAVIQQMYCVSQTGLCVFGHYVRIKNESVWKGLLVEQKVLPQRGAQLFSFCDWCKKWVIDGGGVLTQRFVKSCSTERANGKSGIETCWLTSHVRN